ncbi:hypothetical protein HUK80_12740 [Flavobacterium sp. MAH-1]|uniref:Tetratricopeptide repeat-containing protein n=1 Tax=Flavobacterium agri TaxID=2743471 RepID=A0A7Y9C7X1_9FLAO|nr:tetratricopeptide repeat protein [Flavobacterium agri]NUY81768.1 hypothetical protein [Flavobacterium agri]NYA71792.1 hypothetical protein [Flavobacterium agri]
MNITDYTYLLNHPESINERRTEELDKIVTEFPYFQSARALRLKGLYNEDSFRYNYALKVTAAFTGDRSVLFDFITSDNFTSVDKELFAQKQQELHAIDVADSHHEVVELTMDESFRASLDTEFVPAEEFEQDHNHIAHSPEIVETPEVENHEEEQLDEIAETSETSETLSEPEYDSATRSILDSIKEAEQYAKSLVVADVEEVIAETHVENETEEVAEIPSETEVAPTENAITETEENLEIGKPLEFSKQETHSFHEWLQLSKFEPIVRDEVVPETPEIAETEVEDDANETDSERQKKNELIDKFIESNPKIPKITPETKSPSFIFEPSQADNSYLMTETLARVYLEQKKYDKAIQAYEILILKYPEKNSFFADRILDIRNLQQNNKLQ